MALCLPRKRSATSLATRPSTLSVASITYHSCFTSAGLALKVFMRVLSRHPLAADAGVRLLLRCPPARRRRFEGAASAVSVDMSVDMQKDGALSPPVSGKPKSIHRRGSPTGREQRPERWIL